MEIQPFVILFHHIIGFVASLWCLKCSAIVIAYKHLFKTNIKFSPVMATYFIFLFLWSTISFVNCIYLIIFWRPNGNAYDAKLLYWFGFSPFILRYVGTILEIFLSIDRCISIIFPFQYITKFRIYYSYLTIILVILSVGAFLKLNDILAVMPLISKTNCTLFGCLLNNIPTRNLFPTKLTLVITNAFCGIILGLLIKLYLQSHQTMNKNLCKSVIIMVTSTTVLEILPACISLFLNAIGHQRLLFIVGPYAVTVTSININICAVIYSKAFKKVFSINPWNEAVGGMSNVLATTT